MTRDRKVLVYWGGGQVSVLKGARADRFIDGLPGMDHFKRGNERPSS